MNDVQIDALRYRHRGVRSVAVGDNKTVPFLGNSVAAYADIRLIEFRILRNRSIPKLKKHQRIISHRVSLQQKTVIFPLAEPLFFIDIFVGQIDAPAESGFSVDDEYFSVIPVIVMSGEKRRDLWRKSSL